MAVKGPKTLNVSPIGQPVRSGAPEPAPSRAKPAKESLTPASARAPAWTAKATGGARPEAPGGFEQPTRPRASNALVGEAARPVLLTPPEAFDPWASREDVALALMVPRQPLMPMPGMPEPTAARVERAPFGEPPAQRQMTAEGLAPAARGVANFAAALFKLAGK